MNKNVNINKALSKNLGIAFKTLRSNLQTALN